MDQSGAARLRALRKIDEELNRLKLRWKKNEEELLKNAVLLKELEKAEELLKHSDS